MNGAGRWGEGEGRQHYCILQTVTYSHTCTFVHSCAFCCSLNHCLVYNFPQLCTFSCLLIHIAICAHWSSHSYVHFCVHLLTVIDTNVHTHVLKHILLWSCTHFCIYVHILLYSLGHVLSRALIIYAGTFVHTHTHTQPQVCYYRTHSLTLPQSPQILYSTYEDWQSTLNTSRWLKTAPGVCEWYIILKYTAVYNLDRGIISYKCWYVDVLKKNDYDWTFTMEILRCGLCLSGGQKLFVSRVWCLRDGVYSCCLVPPHVEDHAPGYALSSGEGNCRLHEWWWIMMKASRPRPKSYCPPARAPPPDPRTIALNPPGIGSQVSATLSISLSIRSERSWSSLQPVCQSCHTWCSW